MLHFYRGTVLTEQNSFHRLLCIFSTTEKEQKLKANEDFFPKVVDTKLMEALTPMPSVFTLVFIAARLCHQREHHCEH